MHIRQVLAEEKGLVADVLSSAAASLAEKGYEGTCRLIQGRTASAQLRLKPTRSPKIGLSYYIQQTAFQCLFHWAMRLKTRLRMADHIFASHLMNQLDALKLFSTVVDDTGDFKQLGVYQPTDATTALEAMGASFRNVGQITALAGCDLLAISHEFLAQLAATEAPLVKAPDATAAKAMDFPAVNFDETQFRFELNEDAMATEKLAEGIRAFCVDAAKLKQLVLAA